MTNKKIIYVGLFATLIVIGAYIKIPNPIVPFTLQFFFVAIAGLLLGAKYGAMSVALYVFLGLAGLPIFASGGGINYIFKPTFGYLVGFIICAYVTGFLATYLKVSIKNYILSSLAGLLVLHIIGIPYLYIINKYILHSDISFWKVFIACTITMPGDILLSIMASYAGIRLRKVIN